MKHAIAPLFSLALLHSQMAAAEFPEEPALVQGSLGIMNINDQEARWSEISDSDLDVDFANLFVVGAEAGSMMYGRYLQRFVKPAFVNGVLDALVRNR